MLQNYVKMNVCLQQMRPGGKCRKRQFCVAGLLPCRNAAAVFRVHGELPGGHVPDHGHELAVFDYHLACFFFLLHIALHLFFTFFFIQNQLLAFVYYNNVSYSM